ncbi:MAG: acetyl-CoA carboxylase biotin carboxylase subunit [Dehalococcoidales bacterium]|jgi:pyruvate carboxylase subunit A|nr:acetyl-CoA carboxylase biotin carboxylase subunit [Dehalococcoidales bacterium]MDX9986152.1 acetyl-CoA carboxylase biotin carboxylase subunit [Dehalococcoidales bacterium]
MIKKVLVANRGEIAIRVMRAAREIGIATVAVYSEADKDSIFVKYADEAYCIGPSSARESYLNIPTIIGVAKTCGADAIHPGYGFLAENAEFAQACEIAEIIFVGPSSRVLELVGNKTSARQIAAAAGVPVTPGINECVDLAQVENEVEIIGYPVIIKPADGGGGIGMQVVSCRNELKKALEMSSSIAARAFGKGNVYIEKYLEHPRHIEVQILADSHGNIVHLGERECSIQRMHNKLIEEAPSPVVTPEIRSRMGKLAVEFARSVNYRGVGTVEFIYSEGHFYFIEMNARIQVEHTVTEMVTGIDIVKEQLSIASGLPLSVTQDEVKINGWSLECRINAEDPFNHFTPSPGALKAYRSPGGIGIRVDSGVYNGFVISPYYHPMISKLVAWGRNRDEVIIRMRRALYEYIIVGVKTNIILHKAIMENPRFISGDLRTDFIDQEKNLVGDMLRIQERDRASVERLKETFKFMP